MLRLVTALLALLALTPAPSNFHPGDALSGLSEAEQARYARGRQAFETSHRVETGLGPVFNDSACNRCHNKKGVGGAGIQSATVVGRLEGGVFDPLRAQGGPTLASASVMFEPAAELRRLIPQCKLPRDGEALPSQANVVARRRTTPLFGLGLVDATPDATFLALAQSQPAGIRGRAPLVPHLQSGGRSVGKFGWKAQSPSLHQFSGMALLLELGITNPEFATEEPPLGNAALLGACDAVAEPEEDAAGVEHLTDFMLLLAPIPPLPRSKDARAGDALFTRVGCDGCHVRRLRSGPHPVAALSEQEYAPYSDFLLHDMGALGDQIGGDGDARPNEMRTAPLWGGHLAGGSRLLHDGRARSFAQAIEHHDGQGAAARAAFAALSPAQQAQLLAFLATL
ncbi:MAG TPA: di-heme oxidoredictase family protein [Polyangiaceae bacterium]|nr:di-heme oxidoredictase family protein [Polyangiaceae bacterium]